MYTCKVLLRGLKRKRKQAVTPRYVDEKVGVQKKT